MTAVLLIGSCCKCFCQCTATSVTSACSNACSFSTWPSIKDWIILPNLGKIPLILTEIPLPWLQDWGLQAVMLPKDLSVRDFSSLDSHVFLQRWPAWYSKSPLSLIYLSLKVTFTFCLCTSKNSLVLIEVYSMLSAWIPCCLQHLIPRLLELALHGHIPRGICPKRKEMKRKVTNWADPLDLGTFRDLTTFSMRRFGCLGCQAKINFQEVKTSHVR